LSKPFTSWEGAVNWLIQQPDKKDLVRACYYDKPLAKAAQRYWESNEWKSIRGYLPREGKISLDVGAGNGISSFALAKEGWQVYALEPDSSDLVGRGAIHNLSKDLGLDISPIESKGEKIPFEDDTFDLVFMRQVLHHADDLGRLCAEICRVLKPGGTAIAVREHVISKDSDLQAFLDRHPLHSLYGGENAFRLKTYQRALKESGLEMVKILGSFDSEINLAPHTFSSIQKEAGRRLKNYPGGRLLANVLMSKNLFRYAARLLTRIDFRPGRLYSFVLRKPEHS